MEKKFDWNSKANTMLGNTDRAANPSCGKGIIVNEFSQFLSPISAKNIANTDTIASTIAINPITDNDFNFSTFSTNVVGTKISDTTIAIKVSEV